MTCDCHNSTAWRPGWHTSNCWQRQYEARKPKPESVGIRPIKDTDGFILDMNNPVVKEIWNAAIEAAVAELEIIGDIAGIFLIRKLKK